MAPPSILSRTLFTLASLTSLSCVYGHLGMGFSEIFPSLQNLSALSSTDEKAATAARIAWLEVTVGFVVFALYTLKWARHGLTSVYDQLFALAYCTGLSYFGWLFYSAGVMGPAVVNWVVVGFVGVAVVV